MALPKLATPRFSLELPSTGKKIFFRPFVVKEEKALLMAASAEDQNSMIDAVKNVIASCVIDETVNVDKLPYFDLEYIFLNIRAKSIGEIIKMEYRHTGGINYQGIACDAVTPIDINLETVKVQKIDGHTNKIDLDGNLGMELRYPTINDIKHVTQGDDEIEMLAKCIISVYDANDIYEPDNLADSVQFIEGLNSVQFAKVMHFIETIPKLKHTFSYKCRGCGQEDTVSLEGLSDFF
jgi:hypothetical protein